MSRRGENSRSAPAASSSRIPAARPTPTSGRPMRRLPSRALPDSDAEVERELRGASAALSAIDLGSVTPAPQAPQRDSARPGGSPAGTAVLRRRLDENGARRAKVSEAYTRLGMQLEQLNNEDARLREDLSRRELEEAQEAEIEGFDVGDLELVDFGKEEFPWSADVRDCLATFQIDDFRSRQLEVINASLARHNIICIMPTGGGKSLTYQLPALVSRGCTVVVSPLIALMVDQVTQLHDLGINARMFSSENNAEHAAILEQLTTMANLLSDSQDDIKLLYVAPEMICKSFTLQARLKRLESSHKLARFVFDEVDQIAIQGSTFRPQYQNLGILRDQMPSVPIIGLTATCSTYALNEILDILRLGPIIEYSSPVVKAELSTKTLYFVAPLYRANLQYHVVQKSSDFKTSVRQTADFISSHYYQQSGIIYCWRKEDAKAAASLLAAYSNDFITAGSIKAGAYYAELSSADKHSLYQAWKEGTIQVICATTAFGLGIDKNNVRFIVHLNMPRSISAYYQETGRGGRDGQLTSCILLYAPQDAINLSCVTTSNRYSNIPLHEMIAFCQDLKQCRKVLFARYFNAVSKTAYTMHSEDADALCKCCDNCSRSFADVQAIDVTIFILRIIKVISAIKQCHGRIPFSNLASIFHQTGIVTFSTKPPGSLYWGKDSGVLNLQEIANLSPRESQTITLSSKNIEWLVAHLLVQDILQEEYHSTKRVNAYITLGERAAQFTTYSAEDIQDGILPPIILPFPKSKSTRLPSPLLLEHISDAGSEVGDDLDYGDDDSTDVEKEEEHKQEEAEEEEEEEEEQEQEEQEEERGYVRSSKRKATRRSLSIISLSSSGSHSDVQLIAFKRARVEEDVIVISD